MRIPQLVAHRGYPRHYPENSLIGLKAAIHAGARFVEIDVQLTRDQVPVLLHDRTLERICDVEGAVHDYEFAHLRTFRSGEFGRFGYRYTEVHLASLGEFAELLKANPGVIAFVELKRAAIERFGEREVFARVKQELQRVVSQCVLISYSIDALVTARNHGWPALGAVIDRWNDRRQELIAELKPKYLFCDASGLPNWGKLHVEDTKLAVFEITDGQIALDLAARGVDFVETFAIGELKRELELLTATA
jgi:glycerophosphoryl diester phosphodiesterase